MNPSPASFRVASIPSFVPIAISDVAWSSTSDGPLVKRLSCLRRVGAAGRRVADRCWRRGGSGLRWCYARPRSREFMLPPVRLLRSTRCHDLTQRKRPTAEHSTASWALPINPHARLARQPQDQPSFRRVEFVRRHLHVGRVRESIHQHEVRFPWPAARAERHATFAFGLRHEARPCRAGTSELESAREVARRSTRTPDPWSGRKNSSTVWLGRAMRLHSSADTTTATGSPCRVTVCGPAVRASSTSWLNWFFASWTGHVFMVVKLSPVFWPVKL